MRLALIFLASVLLSACAGKELVRPQSGALTVGTTTYSQVVAAHGEPRRVTKVAINSVPVRVANYNAMNAVAFTTHLSVKSMVLVFDNDVLVSYDYVSSFADDKSSMAIDDEKVKQISRGDKRSKVLSLLGRPGGEAVFPVASPKGSSLLRYTYLDTYRIPFLGGTRVARKAVTLKFDAADEVVDITTIESAPE